ncbi:9218_t:CDS:1, partial [Dentiscutata erythropus]
VGRYENNRQPNVIVQAVLIEKDIVKLWTEIRYYEIYGDCNAKSTSYSISSQSFCKMDAL